MMENLDKSIMRGEKIEITLARSDSLVETSQNYGGTALSLKRQMRRRHYMMVAGVIGIITVSFLVFDCLVDHSHYSVLHLRNYVL